MKCQIAIFIIVLVLLPPATYAKCCSLGGGASYNYLDDPSVDLDMDSYDEFLRKEVPLTGSVDISDAQMARESQIRLNLNDRGHLELSMTKTDKGYSGNGNLTRDSSTEKVSANAILQQNKLTLEVTTDKGKTYTFNLAKSGSILNGNYRLTLPDKEGIAGTAAGKWET